MNNPSTYKNSFRKEFPSEYNTWVAMRNRCYSTGNKNYPIYGGRGVEVCPQWRNSFKTFLEDMGAKPGPGYSIDRIDCDGNYEPNNCRWATRREQDRNRRNNRLITFEGKTQCMEDWAAEKGISPATLSERILKGWSLEKALVPPSDQRIQRMEFEGRVQTLCAWAKEKGIAHATLRDRLLRGLSPDKVMVPPSKKNDQPIEFEGRVQTVNQWAKELGIDRRTLIWRLSAGWSIQKAFTKPVNKAQSPKPKP